jgi:hypothetical protein
MLAYYYSAIDETAILYSWVLYNGIVLDWACWRNNIFTYIPLLLFSNAISHPAVNQVPHTSLAGVPPCLTRASICSCFLLMSIVD